MVIDGVGNVGIGIANPDTELHVKGGATVANFEGTGGSVFIGLKDSDDGTVGYMGVDGGKIKFQTSGSGYSDKLVIDTAGNVGIGTTSPDALLDIESTTAPTLRISNGGGTSPSPKLEFFRQSGVSSHIQYDVANKILTTDNVHASGVINYKINGSEKMRITSAGDVVVGKTAVNVGTDGIELRANGLLAASRTGTSSNNVAYFNRNPDGGGNFGDGEVIQLRKNNTVVGVLGTEKWGIGTANPLKALHVVGDLQVTLAFYDSSVSAGASGQVLSSTATGTSWVDATAGSSFTPDVWQVNTADDLSTDDQTLICDTVQITNGTTNTTAAGGNAGEIRIVDAGTYEITYSVGIKVPTGIATRQVVAMYVGAAGTPIPGSLNSTYLRLPGSNQGGFTSLFNSSYITVSANTDISLIIGWLDGTNKSVDIYEPASVQNAISIRRIA